MAVERDQSNFKGNKEHLRIILEASDKKDISIWNEFVKKQGNKFIANLKRADLKEAELCGINLMYANIEEANLEEANLKGANLMFTNIEKANLKWIDLKEACLCGINLMYANLEGANLQNTDLEEANLKGANLKGADLMMANLKNIYLPGTIIDNRTNIIKIKGDKIKIGINGIYNEQNDTAAVMAMIPKGDSMKGNNPDAIIETLKRARKYFGYSLMLSLISIFIYILNLTEIPFPYFDKIILSIDKFILVSMPLSIAILSLVRIFLEDAYEGIKYINGKDSVMFVASFPWLITKYSGKKIVLKIQSWITRILMIFHPASYLLFLFWDKITLDKLLFSIFGVILLLLCGLILRTSFKFEKPILFDPVTERERKSEIEKLSDTIIKQTNYLKEELKGIKYSIGEYVKRRSNIFHSINNLNYPTTSQSPS